MIDNYNDETNSSHSLLLTNAKVLRLCKAFANNLSANIKLSKTQLHKIVQQGEFLGRLLVLLLKAGLPLMKNVLKPLAKSVLIRLGLTAAASLTYSAIQKKAFKYGMTTLKIWNEEMIDIMKIVRPFEEPVLLIKGVSDTIKIEANERKAAFLDMQLGTLCASLLGNLLRDKGVKNKMPERGVIRAGEGAIATTQGRGAFRTGNNF